MALVVTAAEVVGILLAMAVLLWVAAVLEARQLGPIDSSRHVGTAKAPPAELNEVRSAA